jgi:hypothetical protein
MYQEQVTIRFRNLLTDEAIEQLHQRIQQEAQFQRKVSDILRNVSTTEQLVIGISPETLEVTDPEEAKGFCSRAGRPLCLSAIQMKLGV